MSPHPIRKGAAPTEHGERRGANPRQTTVHIIPRKNNQKRNELSGDIRSCNDSINLPFQLKSARACTDFHYFALHGCQSCIVHTEYTVHSVLLFPRFFLQEFEEFIHVFLTETWQQKTNHRVCGVTGLSYNVAGKDRAKLFPPSLINLTGVSFHSLKLTDKPSTSIHFASSHELFFHQQYLYFTSSSSNESSRTGLGSNLVAATCFGGGVLLFSKVSRPERLWGSPSLLSNG